MDDEERKRFRRLIIRIRKSVTDIESTSEQPHERSAFRPLVQNLYDETKLFVDKHPEFQSEFSGVPAEMVRSSPMIFEPSLKILRTFLDSVEDSMLQEQKGSEPPKEFIILPGQAFTASKIIESILLTSTSSIKIVDNFMSEDSIKVIESANIQREIYILTRNPDKKFVLAAQQAKKARKGLFEIRSTTAFHDRFLIIDNSQVWLCGPSIDYLGIKKPGVIVKIEDTQISKIIIDLFNSEWRSASKIV